MRHGKRFNHLGRTAPHRKAMLSNMASSLIMHKRIVTTVAKAKALRMYLEPLITKSKDDSTHSRRIVFSYLQNKESVKELFDEISEKVNERAGGYTRILKTGNRLGDNADMCVMELVDYNQSLLKEAKPAKVKTRRSRRGKGSDVAEAAAGAAVVGTVAEATEVVEDVAAEVMEEAVLEEDNNALAEEVSESSDTPFAEVPDEPVADEGMETSEPEVSEASEIDEESNAGEEE